MKIITIILVRLSLVISALFICLVVDAREVIYTFDIKHNYIDVILETQGNSSGVTQFKLPEIFNLDSSQPKNLKVYIDSIKQQENLNFNYINIIHNPLSKIRISYELHKIKKYYSNLYLDISSKNFFFFTQYCLLIPKLPYEELNDIRFKFPYYSKSIISNVEKINREYNIVSTINNINNYFFAGGDVNIRKINNSLSQVIFIGNTIMSRKEVLAYIASLQFIHNKFFSNVQNIENYFIFVIDKIFPNNLDGSRVNNFQVISLGYNSKFNYKVKRIIAHENLHQWFDPNIFGQYINIQGNNSWFIEGFNDYYTDYLNYKNGIISIDKYLKIYNKCISDYYTSPLRSLTNEEIGQSPYDTQISYIAYLRGRIIAHELNYLIQKFSDKKFTLDDYIRYLINLSKINTNFKFSSENLKLTLNKFIQYDFSQFIKNNIIENNLSIKAKSILEDQAILTKRNFQEIYYDFDFSISCLKWSVHGVKLNSKAFKAGLRNKQKILEIITEKDSTTFKVKSSKNIKDIKIKHEYKEVLVPQYKII